MKSRLNLLVGLGMAVIGIGIVYGGLTGRLAAMIAALVKPDDLGPAGGNLATSSGGFGKGGQAGYNSETAFDALVKSAVNAGLNKNPAYVKDYDATIKPLIAKAAASGNGTDWQAAAAALVALITKYQPNRHTPPAPPGTPQHPITKSGPTPVVPAPIVAPPVTAGATS